MLRNTWISKRKASDILFSVQTSIENEAIHWNKCSILKSHILQTWQATRQVWPNKLEKNQKRQFVFTASLKNGFTFGDKAVEESASTLCFFCLSGVTSKRVVSNNFAPPTQRSSTCTTELPFPLLPASVHHPNRWEKAQQEKREGFSCASRSPCRNGMMLLDTVLSVLDWS